MYSYKLDLHHQLKELQLRNEELNIQLDNSKRQINIYQNEIEELQIKLRFQNDNTLELKQFKDEFQYLKEMYPEMNLRSLVGRYQLTQKMVEQLTNKYNDIKLTNNQMESKLQKLQNELKNNQINYNNELKNMQDNLLEQKKMNQQDMEEKKQWNDQKDGHNKLKELNLRIISIYVNWIGKIQQDTCKDSDKILDCIENELSCMKDEFKCKKQLNDLIYYANKMYRNIFGNEKDKYYFNCNLIFEQVSKYCQVMKSRLKSQEIVNRK